MRACACCFVLLLLSAKLRAEFDYEHQAKWYDEYKQCKLNRQSPIELNSHEAVVTYEMPALAFKNYDTSYFPGATCENNGHTANVQLPKPKQYDAGQWQIYDKQAAHITGGSLPYGRFVAESLHFHWGSMDAHGSEHVIDSRRYSMEMHVVHRNTKYKTVEEAREHTDGLAVLAVLYSANETSVRSFPGLDGVLKALHNISGYHKTSLIANFSISTLFGNLELNEFYTYEGSLTTPPCSQAVTWIVFSHAISISHEQMMQFHALADHNGGILENNYRALQAKGNRKVYLRKKWEIFNPLLSEARLRRAVFRALKRR